MATLSLGNKTIFTQSGSADPVMDSGVDLTNANIKPSFSSLDTSASQGPTTDLTNTALPIFACRAWVNFDGTDYTTVGSESHCTIRASGNVSKVVRTSAGYYTIYFTTPMPDENFAVFHWGLQHGTLNANGVSPSGRMPSPAISNEYTKVFYITRTTDIAGDVIYGYAAIFR